MGMRFLKPAAFLALIASAAPSFAERPSTSISLHPVSLGYGLVVKQGHWLSLTMEQQVAGEYSLVFTPTVYRHRYTVESSTLFNFDEDYVREVEAHAFYLGPRRYFGGGRNDGAFVQALYKHSAQKVTEKGVDREGRFRQDAHGALLYLGAKTGKGFMVDWNIGAGWNFINNLKSSGKTSGMLTEDWLVDINFSIGFQT